MFLGLCKSSIEIKFEQMGINSVSISSNEKVMEVSAFEIFDCKIHIGQSL